MFTIPETDEIWKVIPGYEGRYEASNEGRLRRVKGRRPNERLPRSLATFIGDYGYVRTVLMRSNGTQYKPGVHQLVAEAFLGPCPEDMEVNHIDLDKSNNRLTNLEYITHIENIEHARRHKTWGRSKRPLVQLPLF